MIFATARIAYNTESRGKYLLFIQADDNEFTITTYVSLNESLEDILATFNLLKVSDWERRGHVSTCRVKRML